MLLSSSNVHESQTLAWYGFINMASYRETACWRARLRSEPLAYLVACCTSEILLSGDEDFHWG